MYVCARARVCVCVRAFESDFQRFKPQYSQLSSIWPPPIWHDQLFDENSLSYLTGSYFPWPPLMPLVLTRDGNRGNRV